MRVLGRDRWGPEQYQLAFMIKNNIIKLPKGDKPLWDPEAHMMDMDDDTAIKRGLFNVKRWLGNVKSGAYLRDKQDPFPDLPNGLASWDSALGGGTLGGLVGAGTKAERWDQKPLSGARSGLDVWN